jgi:hypothetical protein
MPPLVLGLLESEGLIKGYRAAHIRPHLRLEFLSAYVSIRQYTLAYVSIRQHTSAYVSIRQHSLAYVPRTFARTCVLNFCHHTSAYVSIRQHTSAYVSIRAAHIRPQLRLEFLTSAAGAETTSMFVLLYQ